MRYQERERMMDENNERDGVDICSFSIIARVLMDFCIRCSTVSGLRGQGISLNYFVSGDSVNFSLIYNRIAFGVTVPIISVHRRGPRATLTSALRPSLWKKVLPLRDRGRDFVLLVSIHTLLRSRLEGTPAALFSRRRSLRKEREEEAARNSLFPKLCKAVQGPPHARTHPKLRDVSCERLLHLKENGSGEKSSNGIHMFGFPQLFEDIQS